MSPRHRPTPDRPRYARKVLVALSENDYQQLAREATRWGLPLGAMVRVLLRQTLRDDDDDQDDDEP